MVSSILSPFLNSSCPCRSRWSIAAAEAIAFDEAAKQPAAMSGPQWRAEFIHLMSLMHGSAMQVRPLFRIHFLWLNTIEISVAFDHKPASI
jgi:hypothetical protein